MTIDSLHTTSVTELRAPLLLEQYLVPQEFVRQVIQMDGEVTLGIRGILIEKAQRHEPLHPDTSYKAVLEFLHSANKLQHIVATAARILLPDAMWNAPQIATQEIILGRAQEDDPGNWQLTSTFLAIDTNETMHKITVHSKKLPLDIISLPTEPNQYELSIETQEVARLDVLSKIVYYCMTNELRLLGGARR